MAGDGTGHDSAIRASFTSQTDPEGLATPHFGNVSARPSASRLFGVEYGFFMLGNARAVRESDWGVEAGR